MKKILLLLFIFPSVTAFAQLYVGASTYVYAKDQVLFVNQGVNLQANANIYLRNEAQLVQGAATVASTNTGTGNISVFQEGTVDNYEYNYWCSPVGNPTASGNQNFGALLLNRPTTVTASTPALFTELMNGSCNPLTISTDWIYTFTTSTTYSQWYHVGEALLVPPGLGFTMKGTSGTDATVVEGNGVQNNPGSAQRYDFRGRANDGTMTVPLLPAQYTLTGNPYPSALHVNAFLLDPLNSACTGIAYYWEQDKTTNSHVATNYRGGYGTYSPGSLGSNGIYVPATFDSYNADGSFNSTGTSSGLSIQRKYAPIGQGFMIEGNNSGTSVALRNSYRAYYKESNPLTGFNRPANVADSSGSPEIQTEDAEPEAMPHIRINCILNNHSTRQLALAFLPEFTDGVDRGIDALRPSDDLPYDIYFFLDNSEYVIQGVAFDVTKRIPIGVKAVDNTTLKFYVPEVMNFDENQAIYLYDALDGSYHDIKNGTYDVTLQNGTYNNRFEITFVNEALGTEENNALQFLISQDNASQLLLISNPNQVGLSSISLYDLAGRKIFGKKDAGTESRHEFSTASLSEAVYVVELQTVDGKKTSQKIIISKSGK